MADTFGKYELIRKIASGGMAEVFLARQSGDIGGFSKTVAIKRIFAHLADEPDAKNRVFDEARIAANFNHPNIVQIYELGEEGDHLYIAMEYVHGRDLKRIIEAGLENENLLSINMAVSIVAEAAAGLGYAHRQTDEDGKAMNVIHRDVSPQNVLVSAEGHVKLCDFGIAKAEDRLGHTKEGQFKGKVAYMSPEQFDTTLIDQRTDIYSLGVVLYEATTGQKLYQGETDMEVIALLARGEFSAPSEVSSGYPTDLEKIVLRAIARDPEERYSSAEELQGDLEDWLEANQARSSSAQIARYVRNLFPDLNEPLRLSGEFKAVSRDDVPDEPLDEEFDAPPTVLVDADEKARKDAPEPSVDEVFAGAEQDSGHKVLISRDYADEADPMADVDPTVSIPEEELESKRKEWASDSGDESKPKPTSAKAGPPGKTGPPAGASLPGPPRARAPVPAATQSDPDPLDDTIVADVPMPGVSRPETDPERAAGDAQPAESATSAPKPGPASATKPVSSPSPGATPPAKAGPPTSGGPRASSPPRTSGPPQTSGPPKSGGPPAAASSRTPAASSPDLAPSDLSVDDWTPQKGKTGIYAAIGLVGFISVLLLVFVINAADENELKKEVEARQIDPALLEDDAQPEIPTVTVAAESTPAGAHFVVNNVPAEKEGGALVLREGVTNEVTAVMDGYEPQRTFVEGTASASPIRFEMVPHETQKTASLAIVTEPREARIWLNGKEMGMTPNTLNDLPVGVEHHVYLEKSGRFGYSGLIQLVPGSENLIKTELPKLESPRKNYVEVRYQAIPRGTVVYGQNGIMGSTPFLKNTTRPGFVEVEFQDPDHRSQKHKIALERVGTIELRPFLEPMKRESGTVDVEVAADGATLYIGNNEYGTEPVSKLKLKEGKHRVIVEYLGQRLQGIIEVYPNAHTAYMINIDGETLTAQKVAN